jgi:cytochrome c
VDFLKNIALPQPMEHYHLVVLIATISSIVFIPYMSFVLGSSALSVWFNGAGRRRGDRQHLEFSKALIDIALYNKAAVLFLGILPAMSIVFSYAQLLHSTDAISASLAGYGFLFLAAAAVFLYSYKYTFRIQGILEMLKAEKRALPDIDEYKTSNLRANTRSGRWGVAFLLVSLFLYSGASSVTVDPFAWDQTDSVFQLFLSLSTWLKFFQVIALSAGITGTGMLYFFVSGETGQGDDTGVVRTAGRRLCVGSLAALPLLVVLEILTASPASLSGAIYGLAGLAILTFFIASHFLYDYFTRFDPHKIAYGLYMFLVGAVLLVVNNYVAVGNATKNHAAVLAFANEKEVEDLKSRLGVALVVVRGEDIYNGRCSACHLFDSKKVGPPYNLVIPKYRGKKAELMAFVLNPAKKDAAYPPMPNQGLKPAEADSIASYLLRRVLGPGGGESPAPAPGPAK